MSSRSRNRNRHSQTNKPVPVRNNGGGTALMDHPVLIPLDTNTRPILEARNSNKRAASTKRGKAPDQRSFSFAWDETEALGITADMRRSGPGMLSDQDRKDTLYQAYLNSVWISACVDVISKRITSGGMVIEATETGPGSQAEYDQLHEFLHYINDDEDFLQLIRSIATDLLIYGECYMEIVKQNGKPFSLHKIDCITMNYQLDRHGNIVRYLQNMNHSTEVIEFEPDEVIRWWFPDPKAGKKALAPIERILGSIDADVHMADWVRSFFRKGARPNFWIKFDGPKEEAGRFVAWLRENYTGAANAHVPLVLYDGAELYEIGKGSVDIDFLKGRELMCKEILAGYQVPPALVGLIESGNIGGGSGESQEKSFQFNTCDPLRQLIFEKFNYRIVKNGFGITGWGINTRFADYRNDKDIVEVQTKRIERALTTPDEERRSMGKSAYEHGGSVPLIITTKEVTPLSRVDDLENEQRQTAQAALQTAQANADLAKTKAEQAKEPPEPVPAPLQQNGNQVPPIDRKQTTTGQEPDTKETFARLSNMIFQLAARQQVLEERNRELARNTEQQENGQVSRGWTLTDIERVLSPYRVKLEDSRESNQDIVKPLETSKQQTHHTDSMVAFMLDPEIANKLALPSGEPVDSLHVILAYLGSMEDVSDGLLRPHSSPDKIKSLIAALASEAMPLAGQTASIGRFQPAETDKTPVIALVDVPGLLELHKKLSDAIQSAGYFVANNHSYVPHITLGYLDKDAPMPIDSIPTLPLNFDTLCLATGDERHYFKMGDKQHLQYWEDKANETAKSPASTGKEVLKKRLHEIFSAVAERGHKAIGEKSGD